MRSEHPLCSILKIILLTRHLNTSLLLDEVADNVCYRHPGELDPSVVWVGRDIDEGETFLLELPPIHPCNPRSGILNEHPGVALGIAKLIPERNDTGLRQLVIPAGSDLRVTREAKMVIRDIDHMSPRKFRGGNDDDLPLLPPRVNDPDGFCDIIIQMNGLVKGGDVLLQACPVRHTILLRERGLPSTGSASGDRCDDNPVNLVSRISGLFIRLNSVTRLICISVSWRKTHIFSVSVYLNAVLCLRTVEGARSAVIGGGSPWRWCGHILHHHVPLGR